MKPKTQSLAERVFNFVLWLTPCGQTEPGPSLKLIGERARELLPELTEALKSGTPQDRALLAYSLIEQAKRLLNPDEK